MDAALLANRFRRSGAMRLADRIMVSALVMTLGLLAAFGAAGYWALRQSEVDRIHSELVSSASSARYLIERRLNAMFGTVSDAAGHALVGNALADSRHGDDILYPFLRDTVKAHPEFQAFALVDYRGDFISRFGEAFSTSVGIAQLTNSVVESEKAQFVMVPSENGAVMVLAWPVLYLPTGHVEGALIAQIAGASLLARPLPVDVEGYRLEVLADSGLPLAWAGRPAEVDVFRVESKLRPEVVNFSIPDLRVKVAMPKELAYAPLKLMQWTFLAAALLAIGLSVVMSRRLGRRIARPIEMLSEAARAASEQGHAAIQTVGVLGDGEISELARTLNAMGRALAEAHAELEARVVERTAELSSARERLREIFDSVSEVVYSTGEVPTEVPFASAAVEKVFGLAPSRFAAEPGLWLSRVHDEDRAPLIAARNAASLAGSGAIEYRIVRPDGEVRWLLDRFSMRRDQGARVRLSGIASDITEARRTDEARRRAEESLRTLHRAIQSSTAGVIISDCTRPDNPVVMVNPAFERITGYRQDEVLGKNCRFLQGPEHDSVEVKKLREAISARREVKVILKNYRKDGSTFWNELSIAPVEDGRGQVTQFVGIMNDITALVDSQREVVQWASRLDAIFNLSPDGFVSVDRSGRVGFVNPAFARLSGYPQEDLEGMTWPALEAGLEAQADPAHVFPKLEIDGPQVEAVLYLSRPEAVTLRRLTRRTGGEIGSTLIYFRDVTREMEVDRLKSEFLTTAAHELRTPMASVIGFTELLLNREFPEERKREYLSMIHSQARRLTGLLNDLLDLARIEARRRGALVMGWHRLDAIAREAVEAVMVSADPRKVVLRLDASLPSVRVDAAKIQQALVNLLSNAFKYSPAGGEIAIESASRLTGATPEIGLSVIDHGIGMTPAQSARAFERFFRADTTGAIPGTGLGLSLVKEIIETHGGHVELQSEFGVGTRVSIWLPVAAAGEEAA